MGADAELDLVFQAELETGFEEVLVAAMGIGMPLAWAASLLVMTSALMSCEMLIGRT